MNLSFAGCGFLGIYHVGVAVCFKKYAPHLLLDKISGASAGCLAATCLLCDMPLGKSTHLLLLNSKLFLSLSPSLLSLFLPLSECGKSLALAKPLRISYINKNNSTAPQAKPKVLDRWTWDAIAWTCAFHREWDNKTKRNKKKRKKSKNTNVQESRWSTFGTEITDNWLMTRQ